MAASLLVLVLSAAAPALEVQRVGSRLIVTGTHFRYTWDTRRGAELAAVEQPGLLQGGWWNKGEPRRPEPAWQRVNSTFAWKSLDTIPALSFSTKRVAYYSGEWNVAYANADKAATINILKQSNEEVVFETQSNPKVLENTRLPIPWRVRQQVRVLDSGIVLTTLNIELPKDETYELDWSSASVNLDDSLYKEPHPDRQEVFRFGWAFPGQEPQQFGRYKPVVQAMSHMPLDIDIKPEMAIITDKPLLFGSAAYDLTHVQGAAANGFAECALEEARSLTGTKEDFGSHLMIRPQSGMSPVPTYAGSMRNNPSFGVSWNLFDGKTAGLNEPLSYVNRLTLAFGARKRSSLPGASADDRNNLLGARVYFARDTLPTVEQVKAMAAEGCDTLILGTAWRKDAAATAGLVAAAHAAGMRVGAGVDAKEFKSLLGESAWFAKVFEKDRDGLLLSNASFLNDQLPQQELDAAGEKSVFRHDGADRVNAAGFALAMRGLRQLVGPRGFLIADPGGNGPTLLSLAECDAYTLGKTDESYRGGSAGQQAMSRHRGGAGFAPVVSSMSADVMGLAAIHGDTPLILWPAKDRSHLAWWKVCQRLPASGARIESDLFPVERRFTTSSPQVHGSLFDDGKGQGLLLLTAMNDDAAKVSFNVPVTSLKTIEGADVALADNGFDAGSISAWQIKGFVLTLGTPAGAATGSPKESAR